MCASGIDFPRGREALKQVQAILGFGLQSPLWDAVLVSFDIEPLKEGPAGGSCDGISEIGISIFDTRTLSHDSAGPLETRNLVTGGNKRRVRIARTFNFGDAEHVDNTTTGIHEVVLKLLHVPDDIENSLQPRYRNIVLIGRGLRSDLLILRRKGIMFEEIKTIVAKLDTTYLAKGVLGGNFGLESLLRYLQCPSQNLHNAGNDANFTLRALLLLAYYGLRKSASSSDAGKLASLKNLAMEPLPDITKRNAMWRATKFRCEDWTLNALDMGTLSFFDCL
ncbi:hypothetical protein V8E51_006700 [Hyaloscypha variabilis]|jgi:hypothetical protein